MPRSEVVAPEAESRNLNVAEVWLNDLPRQRVLPRRRPASALLNAGFTPVPRRNLFVLAHFGTQLRELFGGCSP